MVHPTCAWKSRLKSLNTGNTPPLCKNDFYVLLCVTLSQFQFCDHLDGEERAGCYALFVFLVSSYYYVALPHDTTGLSAVCDCGIS